jgi:hypothetical protein
MVFHSDQAEPAANRTSVKLSSISELDFTLDADDERYACPGLGSQRAPRLRRPWAAWASDESGAGVANPRLRISPSLLRRSGCIEFEARYGPLDFGRPTPVPSLSRGLGVYGESTGAGGRR